ncbi:major facilitator superfamily domain-containing protein [Truncatella angustata]|uniref:Major facilitator superfamily domain-containing protein n=1 Tax=Truncatella angustata TaxID=152316 RepID=A0A9P9A0Q3_9PEZI|nr:major facilitator superfamily domain-containing protein [Truncatella angustata]KAH6657513.1 major facilitator superfamily domain-containing protein [Truncatella angustata]
MDPQNPMNWSAIRKWSIVGILAFLSLLVPLASSMLAPGVPLVLEEFQTNNNQLATFVVSVFVLGFAFGPLILAPLSELYGRNRIYHVCNALFTIFTIACALATNIGMLIAFRFLAGFSGVAVLTIGSGTIVDLMPPDQRGRAMALWSGGPILGPVIGPVCGGFLVEAAGWRWVFWLIAIASGITTLVSLFVLRETYAPEILERKAAKLRKETGNTGYQSKLKKPGSSKKLFATAIVRPLRMLLFSPLITILCTYVAILYGLMYVLFTTFTFVFEEQYGFGAQSAGLVFIGGGVGNILGQLLVGILSDKMIKAKKAKGQEPQPEIRLSLLITVPSGLALPLGLIMYGWTAEKELHWMAPIVGTGIMGFGMMGLFMSILTYLVDAFQAHAASVTAANAVLRSVLGAVLPLIGLQLYDRLGLGWGNTLLGLILLAFAPVTWILAIYGNRLRMHPKFAREF